MQVISHNAPAAKFGSAAGAAKTVAKKVVQQGVQTVAEQAKAPIQKAGVGKVLNKLG